MKNNKKLFVTRYVPYASRCRRHDSFITRVVSVTAVLCVVLISISVALAKSLPKEAFVSMLKSADTEEVIESGYVYPKPTDDIRVKADRLREIRYEDYLDNCYTPLDGEMDNVYIYDYDKKCYLTFDDGPSSVTPIILDVLNQYKVKATFFVTGDRAKANPELIKSIHKGGHTIGNHSYSHDYASVYDSKESFIKEVKNCRDAVDNALGEKYDNLVFRFPGGYTSLTDESTKLSYRNALKELGYKYIDWSCLTGDSNTTEPTWEYLMETLKFSIGSSVTGDIVVLMHDSPTKEITARTLPKIIEYLYEEGYEFETLKNTVN